MIVNNCPTIIYGSSTGRAPIQVNKIIIVIIDQNNNWLIG